MNESFVLGKGRLNAVWYCDREERCDFCAAGWNPVRRLAIAARAGCQPARSLPSCPTKELFFAVKALAALAGGSGWIGWTAGAALAAFQTRPFDPQFLPLLLSEDAADAQQEPGIRLFEFGAGLRDLVDLRQDLGLVGRLGAHQRLH